MNACRLKSKSSASNRAGRRKSRYSVFFKYYLINYLSNQSLLCRPLWAVVRGDPAALGQGLETDSTAYGAITLRIRITIKFLTLRIRITIISLTLRIRITTTSLTFRIRITITSLTLRITITTTSIKLRITLTTTCFTLSIRLTTNSLQFVLRQPLTPYSSY